MADKYLKQESGRIKEIEATVASAGAGNAGDIVALDASGKLDSTVMPTGIGSDSVSIVASETLAAGDLVNIWNDAGTPKARKADATAEGKEAVGFVLEGITSGASGTVHFEQTITGLSSLTPGAAMYLSTTPGAATATPPSGSGTVVQYIGRAISATSISFEPAQPITVA